MKYLLIFLIPIIASAQETDTATIQCNCNGQAVYVRFGYKAGSDTTKTFMFNKDSIKLHGWQRMVKDWDTTIRIKTKNNVIVFSKLDSFRRMKNYFVDAKIDTVLVKTFKYIPATAIGYIAEGSLLKRYTGRFRFPYSDMLPDDPDTQFYMKRLCNKIINSEL